MGWNGSGIFTRSYDWTNERDAGYKIDAAKFDTENDNFATGINACLAKNGENAATGDLSMGGYIHTGVGDGTALTHYASIDQIQEGAFNYASVGGTANAITATLTPAPDAISLGTVVRFLATATNTGAVTLNVNGLGANSIYRNGSALVGGEIISGRPYTVVAMGGVGYNWHMVNDVQMGAAAYITGGAQAIANGATASVLLDTDLYDPDTLHSTVTNTDRILVPIYGLWTLSASWNLSALGASTYVVKFGIDGATSGIVRHEFSPEQTKGTISGIIRSVSTTSYATVLIENVSGGSITVDWCQFSANFIR